MNDRNYQVQIRRGQATNPVSIGIKVLCRGAAQPRHFRVCRWVFGRDPCLGLMWPMKHFLDAFADPWRKTIENPCFPSRVEAKWIPRSAVQHAKDAAAGIPKSGRRARALRASVHPAPRPRSCSPRGKRCSGKQGIQTYPALQGRFQQNWDKKKGWKHRNKWIFTNKIPGPRATHTGDC